MIRKLSRGTGCVVLALVHDGWWRVFCIRWLLVTPQPETRSELAREVARIRTFLAAKEGGKAAAAARYFFFSFSVTFRPRVE